MPTSSQALIILAVDGRLPKKTPRRTFPVMSVPYPLRDYNMVDTCMTVENCSEEDVDDVIKILRRDKRFQYPAVSESLSDLLLITGYKGSLTFDPATRLLRWQINTELPPRTRDEYGQTLQNKIKFPKIPGRQNKSDSQICKNEFSPADEETVNWLYSSIQPKTSHNTSVPYTCDYTAGESDRGLYSSFGLPKKSNGYPKYTMSRSFLEPYNSEKTPDDQRLFSARESQQETMNAVSKGPGEKMKRAVSLPSLFKARINKDLYQKLCSLGFRKTKEMKEENRKKSQNMQRETTDDVNQKQSWQNETEGVEYSRDKDFRLEDLSLQTGSLNDVIDHSKSAELTQQFPNDKEFQNYLNERKDFFEKYENYESYAFTGGVNINQRTTKTSSTVLPNINQPDYR
jgi:hypothetical protein